jgi:hypothetical protein
VVQDRSAQQIGQGVAVVRVERRQHHILDRGERKLRSRELAAPGVCELDDVPVSVAG